MMMERSRAKKVQARKKQEAQNKAHRLERKREEEAAIAKRKKDRLEAAPRVLRERKLLFKQAYQKHYATIKRNFRKWFTYSL